MRESKNKISFSNKVTLLQFALSVLIVYQHAAWNYNGSLSWLSSLHTFLFYLTQTAVPMFFMISGYLFYRTFEPSKAVEKLKSRVFTFVIPYLIWNAFYAASMLVLNRLGFVNNIHIERNWKIVLQIINSEFSPLWFVKYLIIFSLIAPLMYFVFKNKYIGAVAVLGIIATNILLCALGVIKSPINVNANNLAMLNYQYAFYAIGAYSALNLKEYVETVDKRRSIIGISMVCALCVLSVMPFFEKSIIISHTFRILFGISLWFTLDFLNEFKLRGFSKMSFFIYCSHLLVIQCLQAVIRMVLNKLVAYSSLIYVVEWFVIPIFVIAFVILVGALLKRYTPKVWNIINGKRI